MDTKDAKIRELVEKDERYVWHAMSRYTPVEGEAPAPSPRIMVTEGEEPGSPTLKATVTSTVCPVCGAST